MTQGRMLLGRLWLSCLQRDCQSELSDPVDFEGAMTDFVGPCNVTDYIIEHVWI